MQQALCRCCPCRLSPGTALGCPSPGWLLLSTGTALAQDARSQIPPGSCCGTAQGARRAGQTGFSSSRSGKSAGAPQKQSPSLLSIVPAVLAELLQGFDRFWVFQCKFLYFLGPFLVRFLEVLSHFNLDFLQNSAHPFSRIFFFHRNPWNFTGCGGQFCFSVQIVGILLPFPWDF